jgi:hypothetical protein
MDQKEAIEEYRRFRDELLKGLPCKGDAEDTCEILLITFAGLAQRMKDEGKDAVEAHVALLAGSILLSRKILTSMKIAGLAPAKDMELFTAWTESLAVMP